jgi:CheY-like chemotaxis protein
VVIDDDIRNIFSLASALEEYGIELRYAESGRAGLELLDSMPAVDMVLVDIMMPDMDGYETMREIRSRDRFADLPVVAVTAKAMKGDRQKCIQAGRVGLCVQAGGSGSADLGPAGLGAARRRPAGRRQHRR